MASLLTCWNLRYSDCPSCVPCTPVCVPCSDLWPASHCGLHVKYLNLTGGQNFCIVSIVRVDWRGHERKKNPPLQCQTDVPPKHLQHLKKHNGILGISFNLVSLEENAQFVFSMFSLVKAIWITNKVNNKNQRHCKRRGGRKKKPESLFHFQQHCLMDRRPPAGALTMTRLFSREIVLELSWTSYYPCTIFGRGLSCKAWSDDVLNMHRLI